MAKFSKDSTCYACNLKHNLFRFLTDDELKYINKSRYEVHYKKGENIFKQGDAFTHIACLTYGMAKVYLEGENDKNVILRLLRPVELIGSPGFQVDSRHHFSVVTIQDSRACFIDANVFEQVLKSNSPFNLEFIKYINSATIRLFNKLTGLTGKHMHGRIADALLYLSDQVYKKSSFTTNLSRQDIADMTALTKESCIRILKEFKDEGIIEYGSNSFNLLDKEKLEMISRVS